MRRQRLLIVAIAKYASPDLRELPGVVSDAQRLRDTLREHGNVVDSIDLFHEEATRDGILAGLGAIAKDAAESDQVIVWFGGHGTLKLDGADSPRDGMTTYLLPYDARADEPSIKGITGRQLAESIAEIRACEVVVILDCCHAGGLTPGFWQDIDDLQQTNRSRAVLAGARRFDEAADAASLTQSLCHALSGERSVSVSSDGLVSADAAFLYAEEEIRLLAAALGRRQEAAKSVHGHAIYLTEIPGAPRVQIDVTRLPVTGEHLVGRERELEFLDACWTNPDRHLVSLVAFGGVGKSTLVTHWLGRLSRSNYGGAERVFGWSFYRDGTTDLREDSTDAFLDRALKWFGGGESGHAVPPWEKAAALAELIREKRTLLILDGLEAHQYGDPINGGHIKDTALKVLIRSLAAANSGLRVVTTRAEIKDVASWRATTAPQLELETLSDEAGAQLLDRLGVRGPWDELRLASAEVRGHCLSLTLLGKYLVKACDGDVRRRDALEPRTGASREELHFDRIMAAYEECLDAFQVAIMRLVSFFDRPAPPDLLGVLQRAPVDGPPAGSRAWAIAVSGLRDCGLLLPPESRDPHTLDAHPLVRAHFAAQSRQLPGGAWQRGHAALYEHLVREAPERPSSLADAQPLFQAIRHGCYAGRHGDVLRTVYRGRITRLERRFARRRIPASGAHVAALQHFFDEPWTRPSPLLSEEDRNTVRYEAGHYLFVLGRASEAIQPMEAEIEARRKQGKLAWASSTARILREAWLILGHLERAEKTARESVELADRAEDSYHTVATCAGLGQVLHYRGRTDEAEHLFRRSEAHHARRRAANDKREVWPPTLVFVWGYWFCEFLLDRAERLADDSRADPAELGRLLDDIDARATASLELSAREHAVFDIAHDELVSGRLAILRWRVGQLDDLSDARKRLERAVSGLRRVGQQHHLIVALLALAACLRHGREFDRATAILGEATGIAETGEMKLHVADCQLEAVRLYLAPNAPPGHPPAPSLEEARRSIEAMGYHRRDDEVTRLARALAERRDRGSAGGATAS